MVIIAYWWSLHTQIGVKLRHTRIHHGGNGIKSVIFCSVGRELKPVTETSSKVYLLASVRFTCIWSYFCENCWIISDIWAGISGGNDNNMSPVFVKILIWKLAPRFVTTDWRLFGACWTLNWSWRQPGPDSPKDCLSLDQVCSNNWPECMILYSEVFYNPFALYVLSV